MSSGDHDPTSRGEVDGAERFFSVNRKSIRSDSTKSVLTDSYSDSKDKRFRILKRIFPCLSKRGVWDASQRNLLKAGNQAQEAKYPRTLRILESKAFDVIFFASCLLSISWFVFIQCFLQDVQFIHWSWGIMHLINVVHAIGLFSKWLQILIKSKYALKTYGYTGWDIVYTLLSVFPFDCVILMIYLLTSSSLVPDEDVNSTSAQDDFRLQFQTWEVFIIISRLNYLLRIRSIFDFFEKWERELVIGDFALFILRSALSVCFLLHILACFWHRIACKEFTMLNLDMTPDEATVDVCEVESWIGNLKIFRSYPLLGNDASRPVLLTHYLASLYWTIMTMFRYGAGDVKTTLSKAKEVAFATLTEIILWVFVLAQISGLLSAIFIEKRAAREIYFRRFIAIRKHLRLYKVTQSVIEEVDRFYKYLWTKSRGILHVDLVDEIPHAIKSELCYDINKSVLNQTPLLKGLDEPFLMSASLYTTHKFYQAGGLLFRRNQTGVGMYYLAKGVLEILGDDDCNAIATIQPGSIIGEMHLMQPYPHIATVRCATDCDILTLKRADMRRVLSDFPQFLAVLEQRMQARLEQSGLLLALCEKHNTYRKAFQALSEFRKRQAMQTRRSQLKMGFNFENVMRPRSSAQGSFDGSFEDLDIYGMEARMTSMYLSEGTENKTYKELLAEAYIAVETDVARAGSLSADLNIPRSPVTVFAPDNFFNTYSNLNHNKRQSPFFRALEHLKCPSKGVCDFIWKVIVVLAILAVLWYYPYEFARGENLGYTDYFFHITDLVLVVDLFYDTIQIVITPERTIERSKSILKYRLKRISFYLRILFFLPIEYVFIAFLKDADGNISRYFYLLKFNRLFNVYLIFQFFAHFEDRYRLRPILVKTIIRQVIGLVYITHLFAVSYILHVDLTGHPSLSYLTSYYRALDVTSNLGYGDVRSLHFNELIIDILGVIIGRLVLLGLQSRVIAVVVNKCRQRRSFHQKFYSIKCFMKQRKFPNALMSRVLDHYRIQWCHYSGASVQNDIKLIWDAPTEMRNRVYFSMAYKYISRIPLFMYLKRSTLIDICQAFKHYILPPGEVILYPMEKSRYLYIILKGHVQVVHSDKKVAVFGEGHYFGMSGLLFGANTDFMLITSTYCQVLCLSYERFQKVIDTHHRLDHEIQMLSSPEPETKAEESWAETGILVYPSEEFMAEHIESSPAFDLPALQHTSTRTSFCAKCRQIFKWNKGLFILPYGYALKCWTTFRVIAATSSTVLTATQLSFAFPPLVGFLMTLGFDMIVWIDMVISMRTAYIGAKNQLITNSCSMLVHYLKRNFLLDLLSCLPVDHVVYLINRSDPDFNNMHHIISMLRLNRLLQGTYVLMVNNILEKTLFRSLTFIVVLEVAPLIFILINLGVCFSILPVCSVTTTGRIGDCVNPKAWILNGLLNTLSIRVKGLYDTFSSYVVGSYWFALTLFNCGFNDIPFESDRANETIAILVITSGILMISYFTGKLASCLDLEDPYKMALQEKMAFIEKFLKGREIKKNITRRVIEVFTHQWNQSRGFNPSILLNELPPSLQTDVIKQLYGEALEKSPVFEFLDDPGLRLLGGSLREVYYGEGEYLMSFGDLCDDIIFIVRGAVVCSDVRDEIICKVGEGSLLGEVGPYFRSERLYSAIALEDVYAFVIDNETFLKFLEMNPDLRAVVESCSHNHYWQAVASERVVSKILGSGVGFMMTVEQENDAEITNDRLAVTGENQDATANKSSDQVRRTIDVTRLPVGKNQRVSEDVLKLREKRWWRRFFTFGRCPRHERGILHFVQEPGKRKLLKCTIHPDSRACGWVPFYLFMTLLSCWITSYDAVFSSTHEKINYTVFECTYLILSARVLVEAFFVVRILINFRLAYYDDSMLLVTKVKAITMRYLKRIDGFWLDLVTTFPLSLIAFFTSIKGEYLRIVQILRIILLVRHIRTLDAALKMHTIRVKIFKITVLVFFLFHLWACVWYLLACQMDACVNGSWMDSIQKEFIKGAILDETTTFERYLLSMYYVVNTLTFTGYSEITSKSTAEMCVTIFMLFSSFFLLVFLTGEMIQCLAASLASKIEFRNKLSVMEIHFLSLGVNRSKISGVLRYFRLLWRRCKGQIFFNAMQELPYTVRADVAMELYGKNLRSSRLLGKLDEVLIRQISTRIRHEIFYPGCHIVRAGEVCKSMYFIKKGEVVILDGDSNVEICVEILYENECFGEVKLLLAQEQFRFSYVTRLESEVGVLHREDLDAVMKNHPIVYAEMKEKAVKVKSHRQSLKEREDNSGMRGSVSPQSSKSSHGQAQF